MSARSGPFGEAWPVYVDRGWLPMPLGSPYPDKDNVPKGKSWSPPRRGRKVPPVTGYTGRLGAEVTAEDCEWWQDRGYGINNIGARFPRGVLGVDVDDYDKVGDDGKVRHKTGAAQLAKMEKRLGKLPRKFRSTSRGPDNPSGVWCFRVPDDFVFKGNKLSADETPDIDIIWHGYRYACAWPSIHPETKGLYRWYDADGNEMDGPPDIDDLPELPAAWLEHLLTQAPRTSKVPEVGDYIAQLDDDEAQAWLDRYGAGKQCRAVGGVVRQYVARLTDENVRKVNHYETALDGTFALVQLAVEGHRGVANAIDELADAYADYAAGLPARDPTEWQRQLTGAISKAEAIMPEDWRQHGPKKTDCPDREGHEDFAEAEHRTDTGNARRLARLYGDRMRYCVPHRSWYVWNGKIWAPDQELEVDRIAKEMVRDMFREAAEIEDSKQREDLVKHAIRSEATSKLRAMIDNARSELPIHPGELDSDPYLLCVHNGVVDLKTGELLPHDPQYLMTKMAPAHYRPNAVHPMWEELLDRFVRPDKGKESFLRRAAFASLTGSTADKCFINLFDEQDGDTGKTTFLESLAYVLGPYAATLNADAFIASRYAEPGRLRADLAECAGKRMVISSELPKGARLDVHLMKKLTAGVGKVQFQRKYKDPYDAEVTFTIWLDGNSVARVDAEDNPLFNRWRLVPFKHTIDKADIDKRWLERAKSDPDFGAAVLAWVMQARERFWKSGIGSAPLIDRVVCEIRSNMDPLREFWSDYCEFGRSLNATTEELVAAAVTATQYDISKTELTSLLKAEAARREVAVKSKTVRRDGEAVRAWSGVGLRRDR